MMLAGIVALGIIVRLYGLTLYPLEGDEYNSIAGAQDINLNWNSLPYAVLTHYWMRFGTSEFWLRLPALLFGVASVPILFRVGEKIGSRRCALACALLAAVSPFSVYHSQEMRFYSLFLFASATFLLASVTYFDGQRHSRAPLSLFISGLFLVLSHFLGLLALCAQIVANVFASRRISRRVKLMALGGFSGLILVPLIPFVQQKLWNFYAAHAGVTDFSTPAISGLSLVNFGKLAFAFFTFIFGYRVYPFKLWLVVPGTVLFGSLLIAGAVSLGRSRKWRVLPLTYLLAMIAVFFVLNSAGGRVSSVIGPRHVAFAWPVFALLASMGLSSLPRPAFKPILLLVLVICGASLGLTWRKDWSPGAPDYREAAAYAEKWSNDRSALVATGRSDGPYGYYFPSSLNKGDWYRYLATEDLAPLLANDRIIVVSNEWADDRRHGIENFLRQLSAHYACIAGRVDYPLFEYVFNRKPESQSPNAGPGQLAQPLSIYGLEFQDLKLPISLKGKGTQVQVIGASQLPTSSGETQMVFSAPAAAHRLVLFSNAVFDHPLDAGTPIGELVFERASHVLATVPLRIGVETENWNQDCARTAACETVYHWQKRLAIVGRNSYPGAWRDFQAAIHVAAFELPTAPVDKISLRYLAGSGHLYVWAIALD
jgi:hypothetical protein